MSDIYRLLIKHFLGDTSSLEAQKIAAFKANNPKEYQRIEDLWFQEMAKAKDVDPQKAWESVKAKATSKKSTPIISLYKRIGSIAAIFLLVASSFVFYNLWDSKSILLVHNELNTPMEVNLSDGSIVFLNQGAKLSYRKKFSSVKRDVLLEGEAFFDVEKDPNKPFQIKTLHSEVTVLGTSFNVNSNNEFTQVNVTTGRVKVKSLQIDTAVILNPGDAAVSSNTSLEKFKTKNKNYSSWKTGIFQFNDMPIVEAIDLLNQYYEDQLILENTDSLCKLSTTLANLKINEVAEILSATCNLKTRNNNGKYKIY